MYQCLAALSQRLSAIPGLYRGAAATLLHYDARGQRNLGILLLPDATGNPLYPGLSLSNPQTARHTGWQSKRNPLPTRDSFDITVIIIPGGRLCFGEHSKPAAPAMVSWSLTFDPAVVSLRHYLSHGQPSPERKHRDAALP